MEVPVYKVIFTRSSDAAVHIAVYAVACNKLCDPFFDACFHINFDMFAEVKIFRKKDNA